MFEPSQEKDTMNSGDFGDFIESLDQAPGAVAPTEDAPSSDEEISSEDLNALLLSGADPYADPTRRLKASLIHDTIKSCYGCEVPLDLPSLKVDERPETWRCTGCGAIFLTGSTFECASRIQNAERAFRDASLPVDKLATNQPESLEQLVKNLAGARYVGKDRRTTPRYPISLPAIGMPLDEKYRSARSSIEITLRDISSEGLSLFSDMALNYPYLLVDMTPGGIVGAQVVLKICRNKPLGLMHEIAGTFV